MPDVGVETNLTPLPGTEFCSAHYTFGSQMMVYHPRAAAAMRLPWWRYAATSRTRVAADWWFSSERARRGGPLWPLQRPPPFLVPRALLSTQTSGDVSDVLADGKPCDRSAWFTKADAALRAAWASGQEEAPARAAEPGGAAAT